MSENQLQIHFAGIEAPELIETVFRRAHDGATFMCVRGKTSGAMRGAGSFQWTAAVKAMAALFIRVVIADSDEKRSKIKSLVGHKDSPASSLDYALGKQPCWLQEMFGVGNHGTVYARRIILRVNPERKRPGPVIVGVNSNVLRPSNIEIRWNGELVTSIEVLLRLLSLIEGDEAGLGASAVSEKPYAFAS